MSQMKYCRISTLMLRWDCSRDHIYDLISKNMLQRWPLPGANNNKGTRISMASILHLEDSSHDEKE